MSVETRLDTAAREFRRLKRLADGALAQMTPDRFMAALSEGGHSAATIVKHMSGNMRSRWTDFLTSDGEKPWRDRDREFERDADESRGTLLARWEEGWSALFATLSDLRPVDEDRAVTIQRQTREVPLGAAPHTITVGGEHGKARRSLGTLVAGSGKGRGILHEGVRLEDPAHS